ncbi:MAG: hypothetical protein Q8K28_19665, partial [Hoeflea sp.]|uniref:hypothetical protein n=1 Tax=Hoeflea sp. TaxID=1940281 RepID=UPI0027309877
SILVLVIGVSVWLVVEAANSTSTIHLDGHPDYTGSADEITPRARTLPIRSGHRADKLSLKFGS